MNAKNDDQDDKKLKFDELLERHTSFKGRKIKDKFLDLFNNDEKKDEYKISYKDDGDRVIVNHILCKKDTKSDYGLKITCDEDFYTLAAIAKHVGFKGCALIVKTRTNEKALYDKSLHFDSDQYKTIEGAYVVKRFSNIYDDIARVAKENISFTIYMKDKDGIPIPGLKICDVKKIDDESKEKIKFFVNEFISSVFKNGFSNYICDNPYENEEINKKFNDIIESVKKDIAEFKTTKFVNIFGNFGLHFMDHIEEFLRSLPESERLRIVNDWHKRFENFGDKNTEFVDTTFKNILKFVKYCNGKHFAPNAVTNLIGYDSCTGYGEYYHFNDSVINSYDFFISLYNHIKTLCNFNNIIKTYDCSYIKKLFIFEERCFLAVLSNGSILIYSHDDETYKYKNLRCSKISYLNHFVIVDKSEYDDILNPYSDLNFGPVVQRCNKLFLTKKLNDHEIEITSIMHNYGLNIQKVVYKSQYEITLTEIIYNHEDRKYVLFPNKYEEVVLDYSNDVPFYTFTINSDALISYTRNYIYSGYEFKYYRSDNELDNEVYIYKESIRDRSNVSLIYTIKGRCEDIKIKCLDHVRDDAIVLVNDGKMRILKFSISDIVELPLTIPFVKGSNLDLYPEFFIGVYPYINERGTAFIIKDPSDNLYSTSFDCSSNSLYYYFKKVAKLCDTEPSLHKIDDNLYKWNKKIDNLYKLVFNLYEFRLTKAIKYCTIYITKYNKDIRSLASSTDSSKLAELTTKAEIFTGERSLIDTIPTSGGQMLNSRELKAGSKLILPISGINILLSNPFTAFIYNLSKSGNIDNIFTISDVIKCINSCVFEDTKFGLLSDDDVNITNCTNNYDVILNNLKVSNTTDYIYKLYIIFNIAFFYNYMYKDESFVNRVVSPFKLTMLDISNYLSLEDKHGIKHSRMDRLRDEISNESGDDAEFEADEEC